MLDSASRWVGGRARRGMSAQQAHLVATQRFLTLRVKGDGDWKKPNPQGVIEEQSVRPTQIQAQRGKTEYEIGEATLRFARDPTSLRDTPSG